MTDRTVYQHEQYTVGFLLDNGLAALAETKVKCPHLEVAKAVIRAATAELRKYVDENQLTDGFANTFLRKGMVELGCQVHDLHEYLAKATDTDGYGG